VNDIVKVDADLDPQRLYEARQRFDPAGHYVRPDVCVFRSVRARSGVTGSP
jgi:hypothetical protein